MSEQGNIVICERTSGLANNRYFERLQKLSKDELGAIYYKMNCFEWCDIFGDPPEGYEKMTEKELYYDPTFQEAFDAVCVRYADQKREEHVLVDNQGGENQRSLGTVMKQRNRFLIKNVIEYYKKYGNEIILALAENKKRERDI